MLVLSHPLGIHDAINHVRIFASIEMESTSNIYDGHFAFAWHTKCHNPFQHIRKLVSHIVMV